MRILLCILLALGAVGCAKEKYAPPPLSCQTSSAICVANFSSGQTAHYEWEKLPSEEETGSLLLKTYRPPEADKDPVLVDMGELAVVLWMPSMGHGSSPVALERIAVGTYRVSEVYFTMRGEWEIRVQKKNGAEVIDQAAFPFRF